MAYYGLFRISELTQGEHAIKVVDVSIGVNKKKLMFTIRSSKTLYKSSKPQTVKISAISDTKKRNSKGKTKNSKQYCPFQLIGNYIDRRPKLANRQEQFFVFKDKSPVTASHFRSVLKSALQMGGFDHTLYGTHSLRAGRSIDLLEMGFSVETIKQMGRWKSNAVYAYLH